MALFFEWFDEYFWGRLKGATSRIFSRPFCSDELAHLRNIELQLKISLSRAPCMPNKPVKQNRSRLFCIAEASPSLCSSNWLPSDIVRLRCFPTGNTAALHWPSSIMTSLLGRADGGNALFECSEGASTLFKFASILVLGKIFWTENERDSASDVDSSTTSGTTSLTTQRRCTQRPLDGAITSFSLLVLWWVCCVGGAWLRLCLEKNKE